MVRYLFFYIVCIGFLFPRSCKIKRRCERVYRSSLVGVPVYLTVDQAANPRLLAGVAEAVDDEFRRPALVEVRRVQDFRVIQQQLLLAKWVFSAKAKSLS